MCLPLQNTKAFYNKEEYDTVKCRIYTFVITCYYFTIIFSIITYFTICCHHVVLYIYIYIYIYIYCDNCDIHNIARIRFYCFCYVIVISLHYYIILLL